jgi:hypothetical protein
MGVWIMRLEDKHFIATGHLGKKVVDAKPVFDCPHDEYCNIKKFGRINCINDGVHCRTKQFYDRYGQNYQELFI